MPRFYFARQAGAITLKNGIKHYWVKHPSFESAYSEADKTVVRDNILEALFRMAPDKQLRTMLAEALNQVAAHDFPERWPALPVAVPRNT